MLVFTRRLGEKVMIGKDITVTVLEFDGGKVKLGFEAPKAVKVHRFEVFRRILLEQANPEELQA